jgi:hypothetical protein
MLISHDDFNNYQRIFPSIQELQKLANKHGVQDIFQDNGGKILEVLLLLNLKIVPGRTGNDLTDEKRQYELKTLNINLTKSFSTAHHLNENSISKYREVPWIFVVYKDIELMEIYRVEPLFMSPYYSKWSEAIQSGGKHLNNPKIPLHFVQTNGTLIWSRDHSMS